jgi:uncharacterized protein (DUF1330 family)
MKPTYKVAVALAAGIVIGGVVIQGLHAQATPPTYIVVDISAIIDAAGFKTIPPKASSQSLTPFGGKYLIRSEAITAIEGKAPQRFVVIAFDSLEHANAWLASANQKEISAIRMKTTQSREFMVGGDR